MITFFWNGIKGSDKKLQRAFYSGGPYVSLPADTITIYAKSGTTFSKEIRDVFAIENNTDLMTDYFESDKIRVHADHPFYALVKGAMLQAAARRH